MPTRGATKGIPVRIAGGSLASCKKLRRKRKKRYVAASMPKMTLIEAVMMSYYAQLKLFNRYHKRQIGA